MKNNLAVSGGIQKILVSRYAVGDEEPCLERSSSKEDQLRLTK
jgi:hypothetical protein